MVLVDHTIDELFDVRNAYFMGNYQLCIKEAQKIKNTVNDAIKLTRDVFMYRSYLCQKKFSVIMDEISNLSTVELRAVRLLAEYVNSATSGRLVVLIFVCISALLV